MIDLLKCVKRQQSSCPEVPQENVLHLDESLYDLVVPLILYYITPYLEGL